MCTKNKDGTVEWLSLLGPDKLKLLKNLPDKFIGYQPSDVVKLTQKLWKVHYAKPVQTSTQDIDSIYTIVTSRLLTLHHSL